ncbi:MAG: hypothetical protein NZM35_10135 [Chitinophagales bacterium]|nr:hypothetical protein [Chitinophagales bacterium]MDW8419673.1 hypothetical protein [Chitinophagales bacterium]
MYVNQNNIREASLQPNIMFVDMNSFFPSCEQQVNYWLRGRPVGVCVYTGKHGSVIALSKEAKARGIELGRLSDIVPHHPDFVPVETNPRRYREYHVKIMKVLQSFCEDVIPKSIDEAVLNFSSYRLIHKDLVKVAQDIKKKIKQDVGDWFTCSIGIAPNAFLAKLASDVQKPDGLTVISPETIDAVLEKMALTDLPGISTRMAQRLMIGGIHSPLEIRYSSPAKLRKACRSIVGEYWYHRLNFREVDIKNDEYKSMQAMRQISREQRASVDTIYEILLALCLQLEKRMVKHSLKAHTIGFSCRYEWGGRYDDFLHTDISVQGATELQEIILKRIRQKEEETGCEKIINTDITKMSVWVTDFHDAELIQLALFGDNLRKDKLRKVVYSIKEQFGFEKIKLAGELTETPVIKDLIGFGSIKDMMEKPKPAKHSKPAVGEASDEDCLFN